MLLTLDNSLFREFENIVLVDKIDKVRDGKEKSMW